MLTWFGALGIALGGEAIEHLADHPRVDPSLRLQLRHGRDASAAAGDPRTVILHFHRPLRADEFDKLRDRGVHFEQGTSGVVRIGSFYGARVADVDLRLLVDDPRLRAVLPGWPQMAPPSIYAPLFGGAHDRTGASLVHRRRLADGTPHDGRGVTLCDIDGPVDYLHPSLFHADAGVHPWIDVDGDGRLTVGIDGVDLDGDGAVGDDERLRALGGAVATPFGLGLETPDDLALGRAWLYVDSDGSGEREAGLENGFEESTPAYGEPLFVVDDVDGDRVLDPEERLLRLGTSKIRGLHFPGLGRGFLRGEDLIEAPIPADTSHGTAVLGVLAGGAYGREIHGVAPGADLLAIDYTTGFDADSQPTLSMLASLAWAQEQGTDVFLHEYGSPLHLFGDGSSSWELLIDELAAEGAVQTTATHNFADTGTHTVLDLAPGEEVDLTLFVHDLGDATTDTLYGTIRWVGPLDAVSGDLIDPSLETLSIREDAFEGRWLMFAEVEQSARSTSMIAFTSARLDDDQDAYVSLRAGGWRLRLRNDADEPVQVVVNLIDRTFYSWGMDLFNVASRTSTIAWPSTADSAISVGAHVGNFFNGEPGPFSVRDYSGRGPRIDGVLGVDVLAPDDHFTALPQGGNVPAGSYRPFSGTSGALPQVAGAVALLLQQEPTLQPAEVKQRLLDTARADPAMGDVPNADVGAGALDTFQLLHGDAERRTNRAPVLQVEQRRRRAREGRRVTLDATGTVDDRHALDQLLFLWDIDYDGVVDQIGPQPTLEFEPGAVGPVAVRVQVEDPDGGVRAQVVTVEVLPRRCGCANGARGVWAPTLVWLVALWGRRRAPRSGAA